jgi:hypothetical protein
MKRYLLMACSKAKLPSPGPLPAIERYDGPYFRVLRRFLRERPSAKDELKVLILSAEFGLIPSDQAIPNYDRRMTIDRANEMRPQVLDELRNHFAHCQFGELFILLSADYYAVIRGFEAVVPLEMKIIRARGGQGVKAGQLKRWLYETTQYTVSDTSRPVLHPRAPRGSVSIRGRAISLSASEILERARSALHEGRGKPDNYCDWYVLIDGRKVGPKWLVSQVTGLAVSDFIASEARRILTALGIEVHHV